MKYITQKVFNISYFQVSGYGINLKIHLYWRFQPRKIDYYIELIGHYIWVTNKLSKHGYKNNLIFGELLKKSQFLSVTDYLFEQIIEVL